MKSQFSQLWYRVEGLKPRLSTHAQLSRHSYRGRIWYVIHDPSSGRVHRFTIAAYRIIGLMDGSRTLGELYDIACDALGDQAPTQDDIIQLLGQLHGADILQSNVTPDAAEIFDRFRTYDFAKKIAPLVNPLSIRVPLFDPERCLRRLAPLARPFFTLWGLLIWLAVCGYGLALAGRHWPDLSADILDRVLTPQNFLLLWLVFPVVKGLHELGHALATKVWGGEVHEMGVMFLVFTPVPYVDVSTSAAFRQRGQRLMVAGGGMAVEVFLASLALMAWSNAEPGLFRTLAYNVILIAGVSTILFNANPLLRFDGYYILSDILEMPNLSQRATAYLLSLIERRLFGVRAMEEAGDSRRERLWLVTFGLGSLGYRLVIVGGILFIIAQKSLLLGLIFASLTFISMILVPLAKGINYLLSSPRLGSRRPRAMTTSALALTALLCLVCFVPVPLSTMAEGVVWLPESSFVRAGTDGFVVKLGAASNAPVQQDEPLLISEDPLLAAHINLIQARIDELEARLRAVQDEGRVEAGIIREQLGHQQAAMHRARERAAQLIVKSKTPGLFLVPQPEDLPDRFLKKGETIGFTVTDAKVQARVVVPQQGINLVRYQVRGVQARLRGNLGQLLTGQIIREVPAAEENLPSKILGMEGGGKTAVDPSEQSGTKTFSRMFQFDVELPVRWQHVAIGERVYVRFDHGLEPLMHRWLRTLRQLFLSKLDV